MAVNEWSNYVIGGVEAPKALVCTGYNLVATDEDSFEYNLDGWAVSQCQMARKADITTPQGNFVMESEDSLAAAAGFVYYEIDLGEAIGGKTFVVTCFAKDSTDSTSHTAKIMLTEDITGSGEDHELEFVASSLGWRKITHTATFDPANVATKLYVVLFARRNPAAPILPVRWDLFKVYEVDGEYSVKVPFPYMQRFEKVLNYEQTTLDGQERESVLGWRYVATLNYEFINPTDMQPLIRISEASFVIFYPHNDHVFSARVRSIGDFEYDYFHNKYLAHTNIFQLRGTEVVKNKPFRVGSGEEQLRIERMEFIF